MLDIGPSLQPCTACSLVADRAEQLDQVLIVQAVEHSAPVAADRDQAQVAQHPQLLRDGVPPQAGAGGELLDGEFAADQRVEQLEPAGGGERRHSLGEALGLLIGERPARRKVLVGSRHRPTR